MTRRIRCRSLRVASPMRCQLTRDHEERHGAWNGDTWVEWTEAEASAVGATRRGAPLSGAGRAPRPGTRSRG